MVEIHPRLRQDALRFVPIRKGTKGPVGELWNTTNNYAHDASIFKNYDAYGVVCGHGNLVIVDFDDARTQDERMSRLPRTFTVKSGGKGLAHLYYMVTDRIPPTMRINDKDGARLADIQGQDTQALGPGSLHPDTGNRYEVIDDIEIAKIEWTVIESAFEGLRKTYRGHDASGGGRRVKLHTCRFHADTDPSMAEYVDIGTCFCFGCHAFGLRDILAHDGAFAETRSTTNGQFWGVREGDFERYLSLREELDSASVSSEFNVYHKKFLADIESAFILQHKDVYRPVIIAMGYSLLGLVLRPSTFRLGSEQYDTRLSFILCIRSGNGKKAFVEAVHRVAETLSLRFSKVTSLHAEQLMGKIEVHYIGKGAGRERITNEIEGYFREDVIIADDALPLLTRPDFEVARNYFIQAWDEHPRNEVVKKGVNVSRQEAVRFAPMFVSFMFLQDVPIPKENVETGLLRKSPILYVPAPPVDERTLLARALDTSTPVYDLFMGVARNARNANPAWTFSKESHEVLSQRTAELLDHFREYGEKGAAYASMTGYTIHNYMYKYAVILATTHALHNREGTPLELEVNVTPEICEAAAHDCSRVMRLSFNHWLRFIKDTPVRLTRWEQAIIDALHARRAVSEQTAVVGTPDFLGSLSKELDVGVSTLYSALSTLRDKGIIESRAIGKGTAGEPNSRLWLKIDQSK